MAVATLTSKGQVTVPLEIRDALGVGRGDRLIFEIRQDGAIEMRAQKKPQVDLMSLCGSLDPGGIRLSVDDINEIIRAAGAGQ